MGLTRPRFSQFDTTISSISDPVTVLNKSSTLANIDVGFIINRNSGALANTAIFWNEGANTFALAFTTNSGELPNANISISTYANLRVSTLTATFVNTTGNIVSGGNVTATYFTGSGQFLTGLPASYSNVNVKAYTESMGFQNYGNVNVVAYLGGNITVGNIIVPTGAGRFNGPFNESTTTAGVYVGNLNLSPRIGFFNGTAAQNWQIDNNFGSFRWYTPGVVRMTIDTGGNLNVPSGNIMSSGNVTAKYFFGNGSQLSGVITSVTKIINGTSDVTAYSGGNVAVTVGGTANTVVFTSSNVHFAGSLIPTANLTFDLGAPTKRWRDAYFSGNTIYLGNAVISSSGTDIFISTTGGFGVPVGTTAQRSDVQGAIRFNTDDVRFEAYDGATWNTLAYGTISDFPTGDYGDVTTITADAFGVPSATTFDCNGEGATTTTDLGVLT
jgi:hypothetical protein